MADTITTTQVSSVKITTPTGASSEAAIFAQLETDANAELSATQFLSLDSDHWDFISAEIGRLVAEAQLGNKSSDEVSLIYGQIMLIITCQYLPTISNYLGDQIAQQAATEDLASDVSAFVLDVENGFNTLATTNSTDAQNSLFEGTMSLIGNTTGSVPSTTADFSFNVSYNLITTTTDLGTGTSTISQTTQSTTETSVLAFLTDPTIWFKTTSIDGGPATTSGVTPLSSSGATQISTAMADLPTIFNASQIIVPYGTTGTAGAPAPSNTNTVTSSWTDMSLGDLAEMTYTWTQVYGSSSLIPTNFGTSNAPLVYTMPNTIQADLNQASQAVQTVSTTQQTIQNFTVQEIDQYYGITNSIQQSQEAQCAAIVKHFSN